MTVKVTHTLNEIRDMGWKCRVQHLRAFPKVAPEHREEEDKRWYAKVKEWNQLVEEAKKNGTSRPPAPSREVEYYTRKQWADLNNGIPFDKAVSNHGAKTVVELMSPTGHESSYTHYIPEVQAFHRKVSLHIAVGKALVPEYMKNGKRMRVNVK